MPLRRRSVLGGAAALVATAVPLVAPAQSASRRLVLFRGDRRIGAQTVSVARSGAQVDVSIDIDIDVNLIGLPVYTYRLSARETWRGGALVSLQAECNDNGTEHFVNATGSADGVRVDGSEFRGTLGGNPGTTTYWNPAFLERPVWISTQDGRPLEITARRAGDIEVPTVGGGAIPATRWQIRGEIDSLELFYDAGGEWVGSQFRARGETARFLVADRGAPLTPLWAGA